MNKNKGQTLTMDFIIAFAIFSVVLGSSIYIWQKNSYKFQEDLVVNEMSLIAQRASDQLVKRSGIPANWENNISSAKVIGLATWDRIISTEKFNAMSSINYSSLRTYLGVGMHDFYIRAENSSGSLMYEIGKAPNSTTEFTINVRRIATMENKTLIMDFTIWDSDIVTLAPAFFMQ